MNFGIGSTLPSNVREAAKLRGEALYWAKTPDTLVAGPCSPLFWDACCEFTLTGIVCPFMPCFWPHLIIFCIGAASCCKAKGVEDKMKGNHWIITADELVRVNPNCAADRKAIPWNSRALSKIEYLEVDAQQSCCWKVSGCCMRSPAPVMVLDVPKQTTRSVNSVNGPVTVNILQDPMNRFYGCPLEFHERILAARDGYGGRPLELNEMLFGAFGGFGGKAVQSMVVNRSGQALPSIVNATVVESTGTGVDSFEDRIKTLEDLKNRGILTEEEYQTQRKAIISSM